MKLIRIQAENSRFSILKEKLIEGTSILLLREFFIKIIAIIGQVVLVRVLLPQYFGVFAILSFIIGTADIFTDIGLTAAIIQKKGQITNRELSTIFYIKMFLSVSIFFILFFAGSFFLNIFHQISNEYLLMLRIFSITFLIKPLKSIFVALFERDLQYGIISQIDLAGIIFYYISVLTFALLGFGIWSFIFTVVGKEFLELAIAIYKKRWIPSMVLDFKAAIPMIRYGMFLQVGSIFRFIQRSTIPVISGLNSSAFIVGLLDWSASVASLPQAVSENFGRVSFSGFSRIQEERKIIASFIEHSFKLLSLITLPFIIYILGFGSELIHLIATDRWLPALPALSWFIASTFFLNGTSAVGHAILAVGDTKSVFKASIVIIITEWVLAYILFLKVGFSGIAIGSFIGSILMLLIFIKIAVKREIILDLKNMMAPSVGIFTFSLLFVFFLNIILGTSLILFMVKLCVTAMFYIFISRIFSRNEFRELIILLTRFFKK